MFHMHRNGRHYVRCIPCSKCPEIVKIFFRNAKVPSIAQDCGTIFREETVSAHITNTYHKEALKAFRLQSRKYKYHSPAN